MLITMKQDADVQIADSIAGMLNDWGFTVYVAKNKRPFRITFFGYGDVNYEELRRCKKIEEMVDDPEPFKNHRDEFELFQHSKRARVISA